MKKTSFFVLLLLMMQASYAQMLDGNAKIYSFFDNTEFTGSEVKIPQTMAGVRFAPNLEIKWDTANSIQVGFNALQEFGSKHFVDNIIPTAYYAFNKGLFKFYMGSFPRELAVGDYNRFFFQDSIKYYRPNVTGLAWILSKNENFFKVWLDWTGRQSETQHEAFFMGGAFQYKIGAFYVQHHMYMFHYAGLLNPEMDATLHDNGMFLTSAGIDLAKLTGFDKFDINVGWAAGAEDYRGHTDWLTHHGLLSEQKIEYKGLGIFNTVYAGKPQMSFFNQLGNNLYWADETYRTTFYDRADGYIQFLKNECVDLRLTYSLHFMEHTVYNEQMLKLTVHLDSFRHKNKTPQKPYEFIWSKWLNN